MTGINKLFATEIYKDTLGSHLLHLAEKAVTECNYEEISPIVIEIAGRVKNCPTYVAPLLMLAQFVEIRDPRAALWAALNVLEVISVGRTADLAMAIWKSSFRSISQQKPVPDSKPNPMQEAVRLYHFTHAILGVRHPKIDLIQQEFENLASKQSYKSRAKGNEWIVKELVKNWIESFIQAGRRMAKKKGEAGALVAVSPTRPSYFHVTREQAEKSAKALRDLIWPRI